MSRIERLRHHFVEFIPDELDNGVLYISMLYGIVVHKCCCGCGNKVVTPLAPTDWKLTYDGESVSLDPSIGNWSLSCRSHYWINHGRVHWATQWSQSAVDQARARDRLAKLHYFADKRIPATRGDSPVPDIPRKGRFLSFIRRLRKTN